MIPLFPNSYPNQKQYGNNDTHWNDLDHRECLSSMDRLDDWTESIRGLDGGYDHLSLLKLNRILFQSLHSASLLGIVLAFRWDFELIRGRLSSRCFSYRSDENVVFGLRVCQFPSQGSFYFCSTELMQLYSLGEYIFINIHIRYD